MSEPDILDFDTRVVKAGPLRQRLNCLYFAPRGDYPTHVLHHGAFVECAFGRYEVFGPVGVEDADTAFYTNDLDTAVMALYMAYLNHCNRDLEIEP